MIGHVGSRVSALVDGQLSPAETERLWAHVHRCAACHAQVEREGWVKRQLAGLAFAPMPYDGRSALTPPHSVPAAFAGLPLAGSPLALDHRQRRRMAAGVAVGAGSIGAAMLGVLALSVPAEAPAPDRRTPTVSINQTTPTPATSVTGRTTP